MDLCAFHEFGMQRFRNVFQGDCGHWKTITDPKRISQVRFCVELDLRQRHHHPNERRRKSLRTGNTGITCSTRRRGRLRRSFLNRGDVQCRKSDATVIVEPNDDSAAGRIYSGMIRARHLVLFSAARYYGKPLKRSCAQQTSQITGHRLMYNTENPCCNTCCRDFRQR
jgi:hypothetical protein